MENNQNSGRRTGTIRLAKMGMLVAIAVVLVYLIHFPILPMLPFMEYDPADVPIMIGTFAFGPLAGIVLTAVTCLVQGLTVSVKRRIRNYHALCRYRNLCACGRTDLL
ncbi:MAG: ECF transporter S component [Lentihominibacter sp.]|nr:ECF transporter S component [Lentihominibacter sp.]